jgi:hypothetical protein
MDTGPFPTIIELAHLRHQELLAEAAHARLAAEARQRRRRPRVDWRDGIAGLWRHNRPATAPAAAPRTRPVST